MEALNKKKIPTIFHVNVNGHGPYKWLIAACQRSIVCYRAERSLIHSGSIFSRIDNTCITIIRYKLQFRIRVVHEQKKKNEHIQIRAHLMYGDLLMNSFRDGTKPMENY